MVRTICDVCAKRRNCLDKNKFYPVVKCPNYDNTNDIKVPPFTDGQKEVIEAIEKHKEKCKEIEIKINKYGHKNICDVDGIDDDITDIKELLNDTISRIENPTNEDWLRSATFEELAGTIYEWYSQGHIEGKFGKQLSSATRVVEWLKEKNHG